MATAVSTTVRTISQRVSLMSVFEARSDAAANSRTAPSRCLTSGALDPETAELMAGTLLPLDDLIHPLPGDAEHAPDRRDRITTSGRRVMLREMTEVFRGRYVMEWERIRLGKPNVLGVNEQYSGLLDVDVPLEPTPDVHWTAVFERGPSGISYSVSMHPPRIHGTSIRLRPPDSELERYVEALHERVEATNDQYEREILPHLRSEAQTADNERAERERRIKDAQEQLDQQIA